MQKLRINFAILRTCNINKGQVTPGKQRLCRQNWSVTLCYLSASCLGNRRQQLKDGLCGQCQAHQDYSRIDVWNDSAVRVRVGASSREGAHVGFRARNKMEAETSVETSLQSEGAEPEGSLVWTLLCSGNGHA